MIIRYGENEHGAIDSEIIVQICKPSKCTIIYDNIIICTFGKLHNLNMNT